MPLAANLSGYLNHSFQRKLIWLAESSPRSRAVAADPALVGQPFQCFKCTMNAPVKYFRADVAELRLRVVKVEYIDDIELQIRAAAVELIGEKFWRHAVHPAFDLIGFRNGAGRQIAGLG